MCDHIIVSKTTNIQGSSIDCIGLKVYIDNVSKNI